VGEAGFLEGTLHISGRGSSPPTRILHGLYCASLTGQPFPPGSPAWSCPWPAERHGLSTQLPQTPGLATALRTGPSRQPPGAASSPARWGHSAGWHCHYSYQTPRPLLFCPSPSCVLVWGICRVAAASGRVPGPKPPPHQDCQVPPSPQAWSGQVPLLGEGLASPHDKNRKC